MIFDKGSKQHRCLYNLAPCKLLIILVAATPGPRLVAGACAQAFQQCGGVGYQGLTCCMDGCKCMGQSKYYHQCVPSHGQQTCNVEGAAQVAKEPEVKVREVVSRCAGMSEKCTDSRCCNSPTLACYEKNETWAICKTSCAPQDSIDGTPWSCKVLDINPNNIFTTATKDCGWGEEFCSKSNCCKIKGFGCYEKNPYWAACKKMCVPGVDPREKDGFDWSCRERKAPSLTRLRSPLPGPAKKLMGMSLFCITVVMPNSYEVDLAEKQKQLGAGVFSCEASAIFKAASLPQKDKSHGVMQPKDFTEIWEEIRQDGTYLLHDWTVKAHPDTVFFAHRLRHHLTKMEVPVGALVYLRKTDIESDKDFLNIGSLHVFTHETLKVYFLNHNVCTKHLHDYGEDFYLRTCLDAIDVGHIVDVHLLNDQYAVQKEKTWPEGQLSVDDHNESSKCKDTRWAAFHPFRDVKEWVTCYTKGHGTLTALEVHKQ